MKIFLDTADINKIKEFALLGIVDGITTNPSLIAKEKGDLESTIKTIANIIDGPISAEVLSLNSNDMIKEARNIAKIHKNVVIKLPITKESIKATNTLAKEKIKVNMTLIFSPAQALLAAKAKARYVSPFVGRIDDISYNGMDIVSSIRKIFDNYDFNCEIIVASIRNPLHVVEAAEKGADIATVPPAVLEQLFKHPLTDIGIDRFLKDWEKAFGKK